jgi:hypothetical protein
MDKNKVKHSEEKKERTNEGEIRAQLLWSKPHIPTRAEKIIRVYATHFQF